MILVCGCVRVRKPLFCVSRKPVKTSATLVRNRSMSVPRCWLTVTQVVFEWLQNEGKIEASVFENVMLIRPVKYAL